MRGGSVKLVTITYWKLTNYYPMAGPSRLEVMRKVISDYRMVG